MNIRIFGALMIIVGCGAYGFMLSSAYRRELKAISQLLELLGSIECELLYRGPALSPMLYHLTANRKGLVFDIFRKLAAELDAQIQPNVSYCMDVTLQQFPNTPSETQRLIQKFGRTLGAFSEEGQLLEIRALKQEAQHRLSALEADLESKTKTYQTLGVCAGAAIVVIFM